MIITDFNKMTCEELAAINKCLGISFLINDGIIAGVGNNEQAEKGEIHGECN